ncbi:hypothetical protein [Nitratireductor aquibiodomus]|uniref:hypothetical protein n=1 Tax=Nitratireductor aquibiodomus TaxID=204799 RepID=UPI0012DF4D99|nr:hypothetical protein [Nitratireductor aquibiodomus]
MPWLFRSLAAVSLNGCPKRAPSPLADLQAGARTTKKPTFCFHAVLRRKNPSRALQNLQKSAWIIQKNLVTSKKFLWGKNL